MKTKPMTEGPILRPIIAFTIPIMLSSLLQTLYNAVDTIIVGKFAHNGASALGAVGSTGAIYALFIGFFIGISSGAGVVVAQHYGAKDEEGVSKSVHTAVLLSFIIGATLSISGYFLTPVMVRLTNTPKEIEGLAIEYLRIIFCGMIPSILYNFCAGILRAIGDSKRPLMYLVISSITNVALNCVFVIVFNMDVDGVGWSTVIAQVITTVLVLIRLMSATECYKLRIRKLKLHKIYLLEILKIGVPSGLQAVMFNISNILVQAQINSFGPIVVAARSIVGKYEGLIYSMANSFGLAVTTFAGQNKGARQYDRIIRGGNISLIASSGTIAVISALSILFRDEIMSMFTSSTEVVHAGGGMFIAMMAGYFTICYMEVLTGTIRGAGAPLVPMIATTVGIVGGRIAWIYLVRAVFPGNAAMVILGYPVSWIIISAVLYYYYTRHRNRWLYS